MTAYALGGTLGAEMTSRFEFAELLVSVNRQH